MPATYPRLSKESWSTQDRNEGKASGGIFHPSKVLPVVHSVSRQKSHEDGRITPGHPRQTWQHASIPEN